MEFLIVLESSKPLIII